MARINLDDVELQVGDDGLVVLGPLTDEEFNDFDNALTRARAEGKDTEGLAVALFDQKVKRIENITVRKDGKDIPVTLENRDLIPPRFKDRWIFIAYLTGHSVKVKNL